MPLNTLNYNQQSLFTSNLCTPKYSYYPQPQHDYDNISQFVIGDRIPSVSTSIKSNTLRPSSASALTPNTPPASLSANLYNNRSFVPLNLNNTEKNQLRNHINGRHKSQPRLQLQPQLQPQPQSIIPSKSKITKPVKSERMIPQPNQASIPTDTYIPANPDVDISQFTEEDIIILKNILSLAEVHKWKHVSNRLSKAKSKKLSAEFCINKFHAMYGLPFNPKNTLLKSNYFLKMDNDENLKNSENFEGMLGSSIPYMVSKDGWNLIDE